MGQAVPGSWGGIVAYPQQKTWGIVGYAAENRAVPLVPNSTVTVRYRQAGGATSASETVTVQSIALDLTPGFAETIVPGSARFTFGGSVYQAIAGVIYRDPSPVNGAGSLAGTIDPTTGRVLLTQWTGGGANTVGLQSLVTAVGVQAIDQVFFRTPASPLKPGAMQIRYQLASGEVITKAPDGSGIVEDSDCTIWVDWDRGTVAAKFGRWRVDSTLTPEEKAEDWYDAADIVSIGGVPKIWHPALVLADTIVYNAVAVSVLPPDSTLLGLDAARLPPDGKALIYRTGMLALIHHTASVAKAGLLAGEVIDCGRTRLYRVVIEDVNGLRLLADLYTVDRELGTVTMADPLDLTGYVAPFTLKHSVADLQRIRLMDISGRLTFLRPVSHDYPADEAYVSGMLYIGTLQARYVNLFEQTTWTGVWSDERIGDQPLASFNDALYPIAVTNAGTYPDRILVKFTSATAFQVIGEGLGLIGIGDVNTDCAPLNPATGQPYFTIPHQGWGGGWAAGNCLRFNLAGACYPVDCVRAVQPSDPTGLPDSVELLLVGNVDA